MRATIQLNFMVHVDEHSDDDAWYIVGKTSDHISGRLEWFASFKHVPYGRWPVMISNNRHLLVQGVGRIVIRFFEQEEQF